MKRFHHLLLLLVPLLLTGCIEIERTYFVNPDGSGKVKHSIIVTPMQNVGFKGQTDRIQTPDQLLREMIREEIEGAEGISAWRDISYRIREDGHIAFSATSYFPDVNKVSFRNFTNASGTNFDLTYRTKKDAGYRFQIGPEEKETNPNNPQLDLSENEVKRMVRMQQAQYRAMKPLYKFLASKTVENTYHLPGPVSSTKHVQKHDEATVQLQFSSKNRWKLLEQLMNDRKKLEKLARKNVFPLWGDQTKTAKFLEEPKPNVDFQAPGIAQGNLREEAHFNYKNEVSEARRQSQSTLQELGVDNDTLYDPSVYKEKPADQKSGERDLTLRGLRPTKVKINLENNNRNQPFQIYFQGRFSKPVLDITEGKVKEILLDSGKKLIQEPIEITHPDLNGVGIEVEFEISTDLPDRKWSSIQTMNGYFHVTRSQGTRTVNLGFDQIEQGANGKTLDAKIQLVNRRPNRSETYIDLRLGIMKGQLETLTFYDEEGAKLDAEKVSSGSSTSGSTHGFDLHGDITDIDRIEVTYHRAGDPITVPFSINNVSLLQQR